MNNAPEYKYSELPAIMLFQELGYTYYNASTQTERENTSEVVLQERLLQAIQRINPWLNQANINKVYQSITAVSGASLLEINQQIWQLLQKGITIKQVLNGKEAYKVAHFIDYENISNNDFLVVNQMTFKNRVGRDSKPDLVVFINGLPIAVIECKSPSAKNAWDSAYSDLQEYQDLNEKLFHYNQICCGIWEVGGRYGAITAPKQFYSVFKPAKEDTVITNIAKSKQDELLIALFTKERILDIIRNFVLYEIEEGTTIKKLPRYQQYRATNKAIARLQKGEGGVVWHTQGSGKSLTMAYVTRKLQATENGFNNPTVLIMTDRKDLDRQITSTFINVGFPNVQQANSVAHLHTLLRNDYGGIITTTIQKFQEVDKEATEQLDETELEEQGNIRIEKSIKGKLLTKIVKKQEEGKWVTIERIEVPLEELSKKENLYVLVDEAHRSQYGFLASFMRTVLPNAKFVAFTGTPISKEDKSTLAEFYGGEYIDVYTIKEAVEDGATVELLYDEGIALLSVKKEELDKKFEEEFAGASEEKKDVLKREALRKYQLSSERIAEISKHILAHYKNKIHLDGHKSMLVCAGRAAAIKYQQAFTQLKEEGFHNFESKVVMSIGSPKSDRIAKEYYETIEWNKKHPNNQKPVWIVPPADVKTVTDNFKLPFGDVKTTEKSGKLKHDNTAFIIVSDMLLTGWDAPIASCLYLDKPLKEHNLLQAIARVNRSRKGKSKGYIIDYNGITAELIKALEIFSGDIRPDDILKNINEELPQLAIHHTKLVDFFKPLRIDRNYERDAYIDAAVRYIEPVDKRDAFKLLLKKFNKSVNIVLPNTAAMKYFDDFKLFNFIKAKASNAFEDDNELKITNEESKMLQKLIDEHLKAEGVTNLLKEPVSIIDKEKFEEEIKNATPATKELVMRNKLTHTIKVGLGRNPDFYKPLAQRLEELLAEKKANRILQLELLEAYTAMQNSIIREEQESKEKGFHSAQQTAVYTTMKTLFNGEAAKVTRTLFTTIEEELNIIGWETKGRVLNDIERKLTSLLRPPLERAEAKIKAKEIIHILKNNKE
ncbi:HsdR family type I site-specific deoxyribonuclease [uncultured Tenacibaculum sp.]|uniref:type I restriction endonuclease subunit R n=1 Tax=uncultured Tenacibaculum sp. TaxID=174713 RepID=UPI00261BE94E|nr:HsdR family type I site-specific deoxyribonuclease [uncultured Tenacibaculum sp.]